MSLPFLKRYYSETKKKYVDIKFDKYFFLFKHNCISYVYLRDCFVYIK